MARGKVEKLNTELTLDTAAFNSGLDKAKGLAGSFASGLASVGALGVKAFIGITAAVTGAAAGLAAIVKVTANTGDELAKTAQKVGMSTKALSELKWQASLSNVSFEGLSTGARMLARTMNDAAIGGKASKDAYAALGVEFQNTDGMLRSTNEVMADIADRFAVMPDGAEKTATAMLLLGRSGADMIPMLNGGSAAMKAAADEADRLGITWSTAEGKRAEHFNDTLNRLWTSFKGLGTTIGKAVMPVFQTILDHILPALQGHFERLRSYIKEIEESGLLSRWAEKIGTMLEGAVNGIASFISESWDAIISLFTRLGPDIDVFWTVLSAKLGEWYDYWLKTWGLIRDNLPNILLAIKLAWQKLFGQDGDMSEELRTFEEETWNPFWDRLTRKLKAAITEWIAEHKLFVTALAATAAITAFVVVINSIATAFLAVKTAIAALRAALVLFWAFLWANPIGLIVAAIVLALAGLYLAWTENWGGIQEKTKAVWDWITKYTGKAIDWLAKKFDWFFDKIAKALRALKEFAHTTAGSKAGAALYPSMGIGGTYAKGLPNVPYDNFPALLHQGERVLTKEENRRFTTNNLGGININVYGATEGTDWRRVVREQIIPEMNLVLSRT